MNAIGCDPANPVATFPHASNAVNISSKATPAVCDVGVGTAKLCAAPGLTMKPAETPDLDVGTSVTASVTDF